MCTHIRAGWRVHAVSSASGATLCCAEKGTSCGMATQDHPRTNSTRKLRFRGFEGAEHKIAAFALCRCGERSDFCAFSLPYMPTLPMKGFCQ